jgi:hypothetical protein
LVISLLKLIGSQHFMSKKNEKTHKDTAAFSVAKKFMPQSNALMCTLKKPWQVSNHH